MEKRTRRGFLLGLGTLGAGALASWIYRKPIIRKLFFDGNFDPASLTAAPSVSDDLCLLTSRQAEGPFYFPSPERRDISEDRNGQKLTLRLQVNRHPECTPVEGAVVEIWHCDAEGTYSGYPEEITRDEWKTFVFLLGKGETRDGVMHVDPVNDNRFLRGLQRPDANGWVRFDTIVPGWYAGRVPHIHAKIMISENEGLTTQFYFDTALCNTIYTAQHPYNKYGASPMSFENDVVLSEGEANGLLLNVMPNPINGDLLESQARIGVQRV